MGFFVVLLFSFFISFIHCNTIMTCNDIIPEHNSVIICNNTCINCNILCNNNNNCNSIKIYSGALNTNIMCQSKNACENSQIYIGNTGIYPEFYDENYFTRIMYNSAYIYCTGNGPACVKLMLNINGNFNNNVYLYANESELRSNDYLKDAVISVTIHETQYFDLICGDSFKNCGGNTIYNCFGGNCFCNGVFKGTEGGCQNIRTFNIQSM